MLFLWPFPPINTQGKWGGAKSCGTTVGAIKERSLVMHNNHKGGLSDMLFQWPISPIVTKGKRVGAIHV